MIRKPPLPAIFLRFHPLGECRWCGCAIYKNGNPCEFAPRRNWHDGRLGEPDCLYAFKLLTDPATQRAAVWKRDRGLCYICGRAPRTGTDYYLPYGESLSIGVDDFGRFEFVAIEWRSGWQLEHKVPLWKVAHLPDAQRLKYFQLGNLGIACTKPCAERKTAREAAERAKLYRLAERQSGKRISKAEKRARARADWERMP